MSNNYTDVEETVSLTNEVYGASVSGGRSLERQWTLSAALAEIARLQKENLEMRNKLSSFNNNTSYYTGSQNFSDSLTYHTGPSGGLTYHTGPSGRVW